MSSLLLPYGVVTEFDGLQLHLSRNSPTGYTGVTKEGSGFRARRGRQQIGVYETAVEAAVAYARERRRERGCERVEEVAAAAEEDDESDDVDALRRRVLGEVDPELKENAVHEQAAKWSVKLMTSSRNESGYVAVEQTNSLKYVARGSVGHKPSISAHFSASKSVEVRALGSLIRAFSGWSKAAARVAAVLRNAGVIMLVRRDILSKRGFLAGRGRLVPDGERHEHDSHQNGVLAALLVSRRRRHTQKMHRCQIWQFRRAAAPRCVRAKSKRVWFLRLDPRDMPWSHRELGAAAVLRIARGVPLTAV